MFRLLGVVWFVVVRNSLLILFRIVDLTLDPSFVIRLTSGCPSGLTSRQHRGSSTVRPGIESLYRVELAILRITDQIYFLCVQEAYKKLPNLFKL
jgi:hypothetical protein